MSGVRSEPAEVWLIDGRPARFVWRERLYTVLSILERPAQSGEHQPASQEGAAGQEVVGDEAQQRGQPAEAEQWRCWRVAAAAARNVPPSRFRLCQDTVTGRWLLTRGNR